jgi:hypothetical protein
MTRLKSRPIMLDALALVAASLARLRNGAQELSNHFNLEAHVDALLAIFEEVIGVNMAAPAPTS